MSPLIRTVSILLGVIVGVAGIGKLLAMEPFIDTVSGIFSLQPSWARSIAYLVVGVEILGGVSLVLGFQKNVVPFVFALLLGAFIAVLAYAVLGGREFACNCFGTFNLALSNRHELILDFVLFDASGALVLSTLFQRRSSLPEQKKSARWVVIAIAAVTIVVEISLVIAIVIGIPV